MAVVEDMAAEVGVMAAEVGMVAEVGAMVGEGDMVAEVEGGMVADSCKDLKDSHLPEWDSLLLPMANG